MLAFFLDEDWRWLPSHSGPFLVSSWGRRGKEDWRERRRPGGVLCFCNAVNPIKLRSQSYSLISYWYFIWNSSSNRVILGRIKLKRGEFFILWNMVVSGTSVGPFCGISYLQTRVTWSVNKQGHRTKHKGEKSNKSKWTACMDTVL